MPTLPFELIEVILDIVAHSDGPGFPSTKTCALVCYDFHQICRKHIFASIALGPITIGTVQATKTNASSAELHQLLDDTPEIGALIRNLEFCIQSVHLAEHCILQRTFQKISHLENLAIDREDGEFQWNDNSLRPALLHLLQSPTLCHLRLQNISDFLVADLFPCVSLRGLAFSAKFTVFDSPDRRMPEGPLRLRRIKVGHHVESIAKFFSLQCTDQKPFIDLEKLSDLSVGIFSRSDIAHSRLLFSRCKRLSFARISVSTPWMDFTQIGLFEMLLPTVQTLKHLMIEYPYYNKIRDDNPLTGLTIELEKLKGNYNIEYITISVLLPPVLDCMENTESEWRRLDTILTSSAWSNLRAVSLKIKLLGHPRVDHLELMSLLEKHPATHLPNLSSSKAILFNFSIHRGSRLAQM
ncbi:hypothetical protein BDN70DRAFT_994351 [Pholiota conissans]|uniref:Uncharacterized protein n=1 Tax=Pholiota conissans TaxID=109636 RepID=A0A9P5Z034_9AGAR|nr:hypothetical protein BDN70DRAFT_994351 [Pholiota conissans]